MAKPNIDMDRVAHATAPPVAADIALAIANLRRSPNLVCHCAIIAAFLCLGLGAALLKWGIAVHSQAIVWSALALFILSFAIWVAMGIAALIMLWGLITNVMGAMRREHP